MISFFQNFFETLCTWLFPIIFKLGFILAIAFFTKYFIDIATSNFVSKFRNTKRARTLTQIISSTSRVIIITVSGMMILHEMGFDIRPIIASAGIIGVAFGLGAQNLMKDIINGFFILFEDQFGIGDSIKIGEIAGIVERMNLRTTTLKDSDGNFHIIPNGEIKQVSVLIKNIPT